MIRIQNEEWKTTMHNIKFFQTEDHDTKYQMISFQTEHQMLCIKKSNGEFLSTISKYKNKLGEIPNRNSKLNAEFQNRI